MKKILLFVSVCVTTLLCALTLLALPASAEVLEGECGYNVTYSLDLETGVMEFEGDGYMYSRPYEKTPWYDFVDEIRTVVVKDGVLSICCYAFEGADQLTSVTIPKSVLTIEVGAFNDCPLLEEIKVDAENENYCLIDGSLYSKDGETLLYYVGANVGALVIPDHVKHIDDYAFSGCSSLTAVTMGKNVQSIGSHSFYNCVNLERVEIPDNLYDIGFEAFDGCESLTNRPYRGMCGERVHWEYDVQTGTLEIAGTGAMWGYEFSSDAPWTRADLTINKLQLGEGITSIGNNAFANCEYLSYISFPNSLTSIGKSAFQNCKRITALFIPSNLTNISTYAFSKLESLKEIKVSTSNPTYHGANNCLIQTENKRLVLGCSTSVIPDDGSVTRIGTSAFYYCKNLTEITIPETVTDIFNFAFYGCTGLKSITLPQSLTKIGESAFYGCTGLQSITIPQNVKQIGQSAFYNCSSLDVIYFNATAAEDCEFSALAFKNKGACKLVIGANVTRIPGNLFRGCSMTEVEFAFGSVCRSIGEGAFNYCEMLTHVMLPDTVRTIGERAFYDCKSLQSVQHHISSAQTLEEWKAIVQVGEQNEKLLQALRIGHIYGGCQAYDLNQHKCVCACGEVLYVDHDWEVKWVTDPTTEAEGAKRSACATCDFHYTERLAKLPLPAESNDADQSSDGLWSEWVDARLGGCGASLTGSAGLMLLISLAGVCLMTKKKEF